MKKVIISAVLIITLLSLCSCPGKKHIPSNDPNALTLDAVCELSKKGEELTWSDLEKYSFTETGSGLYIRVYDINDHYRLAVGGSPDTKPMYIRLTYKKTAYEYIDIRYENVNEFIKRTSSIKNGTKRFIANVVQNGKIRIPSGAFKEGMLHDKGELILSVTDIGNSGFKNDDLYKIVIGELTGDTECPVLVKGDIVMVELDEKSEVIPFGEVPYKIENAVSVQRCSELGKIITPLEKLPSDYSLSDAHKDGCVVYKDLDVAGGKEHFESFLANVKYKSPANVRLAFYYSESDLMFVQDLYFNGTDFMLRQTDGTDDRIDSYKHLMRYDQTDPAYDGYVRYVLTNDDSVTYSELLAGLYSSDYGDYIPHAQVYREKISDTVTDITPKLPSDIAVK